jgi:hypothetical protein
MSTNVNAAVSDWNTQHANAITDLDTLEATLKDDFNKYVDSLSNYLERLKDSNNIRNNYIISLDIEDVSNNTRTRVQFTDEAAPPIENNAIKYLLDNHEGDQVTRSVFLTKAYDATKLLNRKIL